VLDVRGGARFGRELDAGGGELVDGCGEVALGGGDVSAGLCAPLVPIPLGELIYLAGRSLLRILESFELMLRRVERGAGSGGLPGWSLALVDESFAERLAIGCAESGRSAPAFTGPAGSPPRVALPTPQIEAATPPVWVASRRHAPWHPPRSEPSRTEFDCQRRRHYGYRISGSDVRRVLP
jgi:hypothetical protein